MDDHEIEIDPRTHRYDDREPEQQEDEDQEIEKQIEQRNHKEKHLRRIITEMFEFCLSYSIVVEEKDYRAGRSSGVRQQTDYR